MFSAISDPLLRAALWAGVAALLLTAVITVVIVLLRLSLQHQERRWLAFVEQWRPRLLNIMLAPDRAEPMPPLPSADRQRFLRLWVYLQESVRGDARDHLNTAARVLGVDVAARAQLRRSSRTARLLAVLALGPLRDASAWADLERLARDADPLLSLHAARALVQIDPLRGIERLLPLVIARRDWDVARLAGFLAEARDAVWLHLMRLLPTVPQRDLPRALRLAEALRLDVPEAQLRRLLRDEQGTAVLRAALPLVRSPALHDEVWHALSHPDAGVREQALLRMSDLATPQDLVRIGGLLQDEVPRVRLASARTLVGLPFVNERTLASLDGAAEAGRAELAHARAERDIEARAA